MLSFHVSGVSVLIIVLEHYYEKDSDPMKYCIQRDGDAVHLLQMFYCFFLDSSHPHKDFNFIPYTSSSSPLLE